jgi:hypothetical protein
MPDGCVGRQRRHRARIRNSPGAAFPVILKFATEFVTRRREFIFGEQKLVSFSSRPTDQLLRC